VPIPGTIAVDDKGEPLDMHRDTLYTVIAEVQGTAVQWTGAWISNRYFSIIVSPVEGKQIIAGKRFADEAPVVITTTKNPLYKMELTLGETKSKQTLPPKGGEILLEGLANTKPFTYRISSLSELASPQYQ